MTPRGIPSNRRLDLLPDSLAERLARRTRPGVLFERAGDDRIHCTACAHRCVIAEGRPGACGVRLVRGGELRVPWGYVARRYVRSVETNTVFHVLPGSRALTFGMYGCDLRCPYCHNWKLSQALREQLEPDDPEPLDAAALVEEALEAGCAAICSAYNEPMISAEWAHAVFEEAKRRGLVTVLVSDGHSTNEALAYMRPVTDVFRVDLKSPDEEGYRRMGGRLQPVLDAIECARSLGYWVEVVTLVVPGLSDDPTGLARLARRLRDIDPALVWHLNAFHPRYRMERVPRTGSLALVSAAGSAYAQGLQFVYASNAAELTELSHTRCPDCREVLVRRRNFTAVETRLRAGACPRCERPIPGLWRSDAGVRVLA